MSDGLQTWEIVPVEPRDIRGESNRVMLYAGDRNQVGVQVVETWALPAEILVAEHNRQVEWARTVRQAEAVKQQQSRTTIGDVEAMLTRVAVATVREVVRGVRPVQVARWLLRSRPDAKPVSTPGGNPVREEANRG